MRIELIRRRLKRVPVRTLLAFRPGLSHARLEDESDRVLRYARDKSEH